MDKSKFVYQKVTDLKSHRHCEKYSLSLAEIALRLLSHLGTCTILKSDTCTHTKYSWLSKSQGEHSWMKKNYKETQECYLLSPTSCQHYHVSCNLQILFFNLVHRPFIFLTKEISVPIFKSSLSLPSFLLHFPLFSHFLLFAPHIKRKRLSKLRDQVRPSITCEICTGARCKPWSVNTAGNGTTSFRLRTRLQTAVKRCTSSLPSALPNISPAVKLEWDFIFKHFGLERGPLSQHIGYKF